MKSKAAGTRGGKRWMGVLLVAGIIITLGVIIPTSIVLTRRKSSGTKHKRSDITENKVMEYFKLRDGIEIKFAHAVNSQSKLNSSLDDQSILVLEADVLMDKTKNEPIMAHPPATSSDLSLKEFLTKVASFETPKGIKLDFKEIEVVQPSLEILKQLKKTFKIMPLIMLNADILEGPDKPARLPVNATEFIRLCQLYDPTSILSPGWTTTAPRNTSAPEGYTWKMVEEMYDLLKDVKQPVTFPVRASLTAISQKQLLWLLKQREDYSLTLWHSSADQYDIRKVGFLRQYPLRVYYDLPKEKIDILKAM